MNRKTVYTWLEIACLVIAFTMILVADWDQILDKLN
jgi:hypothetical protein